MGNKATVAGSLFVEDPTLPLSATSQRSDAFSTESKCPFNHNANGGASNQDRWPNQVGLNILHQHSFRSDPMDVGCNYAEAFQRLDLTPGCPGPGRG